jgi:hypothetical protein
MYICLCNVNGMWRCVRGRGARSSILRATLVAVPWRWIAARARSSHLLRCTSPHNHRPIAHATHRMAVAGLAYATVREV